MHLTPTSAQFTSILTLFLALTTANTTALAKNQCVQNIEKHVVDLGGGKRGPHYLTLNLNSCNLQDRDMKDVVTFLKTQPKIISLNFSDNFLTGKGITLLAESNLSFTIIDAEDNDLGDSGAAEFAKILAHPDWYSTYLNLSHNRISDEGAKSLATNPTWETIRLEKNNISDEGVSALASNYAIHSFYLAHNNIGDKGALALDHYARLYKTTETIDVKWNHIGKNGLEALQSLKTDNIIWNLFIDNNDGE